MKTTLSESLALSLKNAATTCARLLPSQGPEGAFAVEFESSGGREPDVTLSLVGAPRDLSRWPAVALDVTNPGTREAALQGIVDGNLWTDGAVFVAPGATETLWLFLKVPRGEAPPFVPPYVGMFGSPGDGMIGWYTADPRAVRSLSLRPLDLSRPVRVTISRVRLARYHPGTPGDLDQRGSLPIVDEFGQLRHREWPGKIHAEGDLARAPGNEDEDPAARRGPADWDRYGGWATGPLLEATGHFRTQKVDGLWWLVDPEGHLFWSVGCNDVGVESSTDVTGREALFSWIPAPRDPVFGSTRADGMVNFYGMNLARKHGSSWEASALARIHSRMRSWGLNTIGNWSDARLQRQRRTPYTHTLRYEFPSHDDPKLPDVSDPRFRANLRAALEQAAGETARNPWCIGYFIDNELHWPASGGGENAEAYFRTCAEEVKRVAPQKLYLGARFEHHLWPEHDESRQDIIAAAARWCDVVSFNRYRFAPGRLRLCGGIDKPMIIGEFHFGALDRGALHVGVRGVGSQRQRGAAVRFYLRECLRNPGIVGAHWYRFMDQCVTGRPDGENYQIGLVDICDTPYPETIDALRDAGYGMFVYRTGNRA